MNDPSQPDLEYANMLIERMAAGFVHDLNNLSGPLVGYCELIQQEKDLPESVYDDLKMIGRALAKMKEYSHDLSLIAVTSEVTLQTCDSNSLIKEIQSDSLHPDHYDGKIALNFSTSADLPAVKAAPTYFQQIHEILIALAQQSSSVGSTVNICWYAGKDGNLATEISHPCKPIDPSHIEHLFEPYYMKKVMGLCRHGLFATIAKRLCQTCLAEITVTAPSDGGLVYNIDWPTKGLPSL